MATYLWGRSFMFFGCLAKAVDKALPVDVKGLMQESNGSSLQRALPDGLVGIGCYENDRYFKAELRQVVLQFDSAHVSAFAHPESDSAFLTVMMTAETTRRMRMCGFQIRATSRDFLSPREPYRRRPQSILAKFPSTVRSIASRQDGWRRRFDEAVGYAAMERALNK
jgi:hypothetical protein